MKGVGKRDWRKMKWNDVFGLNRRRGEGKSGRRSVKL